MKKYLEPNIELVEFECLDVLNASEGDSMDVGGDWNDSWDRREL